MSKLQIQGVSCPTEGAEFGQAGLVESGSEVPQETFLQTHWVRRTGQERIQQPKKNENMDMTLRNRNTVCQDTGDRPLGVADALAKRAELIQTGANRSAACEILVLVWSHWVRKGFKCCVSF